MVKKSIELELTKKGPKERRYTNIIRNTISYLPLFKYEECYERSL